MQAKELRDKSIEQLNTELAGLLKSHFSLRMQVAMQQLTKNSELGRVKKDIARIKTVLREKAGKNE
jgi:large subunit ribosomal protein L29